MEQEKEIIPNQLYKYSCIKEKRVEQLKEGNIWLSTRFLMNDPLDLLLLNTELLTDEEKNYFKSSVKDKYYLCLSSQNNNPIMWAHYANSFKGYCIGFKIKRDIFNDEYQIRKIQYVKDGLDLVKEYKLFYEKLKEKMLPTSLVDALLLELNEPQEYNDLERLGKKLFYSKTIDWQYESEYRILTTDQFRPKEKGKICNISDLGLEITDITFGIKTNKRNKNMVKRIMGNDINYYQLSYDGVQLIRKEDE